MAKKTAAKKGKSAWDDPAYRKRKPLSKAKAGKMLKEKSAHGHPLTDAQRRYFGVISRGAQDYYSRQYAKRQSKKRG